MTFAIPLALLVLLAWAGPLIAHALRQGPAEPLEFPAARLVASERATTQKRRRLRDPWLLFVRVLAIGCLAVLGAAPFVACDRLALERNGGASVAVVIVLDDSGSMRMVDAGKSRFERAVEGARELLESARSGDTFALILVGHPARIALPLSGNFRLLNGTLEALTVRDRRTDLEGALALAQRTLADSTRGDKRLIVLSDQAARAPTLPVDVSVSMPISDLARPFENCGVIGATLAHRAVEGQIACTSPRAAVGRTVEVRDAGGRVLARAPVSDYVTLDVGETHGALSLVLQAVSSEGVDQLAEDDALSVIPQARGLSIGISVDPRRSSSPGSSATVLSAALSSLGEDLHPIELSALPERAQDFEGLSALILDDPPGLTPETSSALEGFAKNGGVLFTLLGPRIGRAPLGSTFFPLTPVAPTWDESSVGAARRGSDVLGALTEGWVDLEPRGRAVVPDPLSEATVLARFSDEKPLVFETALELGLSIVALLPSSVDVSDFALRPAFLALLDHVASEARLRRGVGATSVGEAWTVPVDAIVTGPFGRVSLDSQRVIPDAAGRYVIESGAQQLVRHALRDADETTVQPTKWAAPVGKDSGAKARQRVDVSREVALALLLLTAAEIAIRTRRTFLRGARRPFALFSKKPLVSRS